ncbi:MAG: ribonuclease III [Acetivibrionales bacterium]|jgi:ribonuclease-3
MKNTANFVLENLSELEQIIGYSFNDKNNLILALSHSSFANENKNKSIKSNERLEFLGDAVLNIVISENIFKNYPDLTEGEMTKARANIVCESSLVICANNISIGKYLLLGKGEEVTGGRNRPSILSDAFEALIGAIYIDGGLERAKLFIYRSMENIIEDSISGIIFMDYKTQLQEDVQKNGNEKIHYEIIDEKGPDHNKTFVTQVKIGEDVFGIGVGKSKKESEQNAAKVALRKIK